MSPPETDLSIAEIVMPKGNLKDSDATKQIKNTPLLGRVFYLGHEGAKIYLFAWLVPHGGARRAGDEAVASSSLSSRLKPRPVAKFKKPQRI